MTPLQIHNRLRRGSGGFTLFEMMLAVGLCTLLMMAVYAALQIYFDLQLDSHEEITRQQVARALMRSMTRDIQSTVFVKRTVVDESDSSSSSSSTSSSSSSSASGSSTSSGSSMGTGTTSGTSTGGSTTGGSTTGGSTSGGTSTEQAELRGLRHQDRLRTVQVLRNWTATPMATPRLIQRRPWPTARAESLEPATICSCLSASQIQVLVIRIRSRSLR